MNRSNIFRFRDFPVYNEIRKFRLELKSCIRQNFPSEEKFCLLSQIYRALDSILLNIAEGSGRYSDLDFSRFLNNSISSLHEVVAGLDCAFDDNYLKQEEYNYYYKWSEEIFKQLSAFCSKVRNDNKRN